MTNNVLLAGTSFSAVPIYAALKRLGFRVAVCGARPDDPCHAFADQSHAVNYAQRDDLLELVRTEGYRYVVPSCNDEAYRATAWVAEQLGLPGHDSTATTHIMHEKSAFREYALKQGFPVPRAEVIELSNPLLGDSLRFPALVKPVDSSGGRGVIKVADEAELRAASARAIQSSQSGKAIVEEFIDGSLHSHSMILKAGKAIFEVVADEFCSVYPYQVDCSNIPSYLSAQIRAEVSNCMQQLAQQLGLVDGLLHTQFMIRGQHFWIIECMRRCPGDLYYKMVEMATGVDGHELYVSPFVNLPLPQPLKVNRFNFIARHTVSAKHDCIQTGFQCKLPGKQLEVVPLKDSGLQLKHAPFDKSAILFLSLDSQKELHAVTPRLAELIQINTLNTFAQHAN